MSIPARDPHQPSAAVALAASAASAKITEEFHHAMKIGSICGRHTGRTYLIHAGPIWLHIRTAPFKAAWRDGISLGRRPRD